jgi:hypothetical protein
LSAVSGDLLSAASLLTTVIGLLYTLWYPEIDHAASMSAVLRDPAKTVAAQTTLRTRALPLAASAVFLVVLLAWPAIQASTHIFAHDAGGYDAVQACFVAVVLLLILLAVTSTSAALRVWGTLRRLRQLPEA